MKAAVRGAAVAVLAALLAACGEERTGQSDPGEDVPPLALTVVITPSRGDDLILAGAVMPQASSQLGFPMLGRLMSHEVSVGDVVRRGDPLAALDSTGLAAALEAARADLRSAQAQLENASDTHERQQTLGASGTVPPAALEAAELQLKTARAKVESATAGLSQARDQLANAQLVAGFDGVVTAVSGEIGQVVAAGSPVVTLARPELHDAVVDMTERLLSGLRIGDTFEAALEIDPAITAQGRIREIAPAADAATRLHRVRIALDEPPAAFRFGTTVLVRPVAPRAALPSVPATAVIEGEDGAFVWIVEQQDRRVSRRAIVIAERAGDRVTVEEGLDMGERVVVAGVRSLVEGQAVRVSKAESR
ncbi:efflux RND transporter periplasmic adaptor subunit [Aliihoeflea sp. 40Bstr573]|uniref:efflux RND transporter periplasmic adaptor subunit n=1 Tax=Aliihoeflea sp. 40Bstr573 TaxID=2696467 RepID=UPI0020949231|nr:efflux RND transporter periplasmic adaptor subunit [Aliihoeflea sp. 40Bstr573]MCO6389339.1 efflux RND transporter periplasmic adaptor subunit [Aliihoeflea sp. 40Bstr573]